MAGDPIWHPVTPPDATGLSCEGENPVARLLILFHEKCLTRVLLGRGGKERFRAKMTRETGDKVRTGPGMQQGLQPQRGGGGAPRGSPQS